MALGVVQVWGEGLRTATIGGAALGRSGGRLAHIDDATAIQHNPANLTDLERAEVDFTPSLVYIEVEFDSIAGQSAKTENPWKLTPNLFAAVPFGDGRYAMGLGVTMPYGLSVEWESNRGAFAPPDPASGFQGGILRYQAPYFNELKTVNMNPTFAMKLGSRFQIGVGVDVMWSELELRQYLPWTMVLEGLFPGAGLQAPEGRIRAEGDGVGIGGNVGITYQLTDRQRLAATMRTPMDIDYDGDFKASHVPPPLAGGFPASTSFGTDIDYPMTVQVGYGIQLTDAIRMGADVEWVQWSSVDSFPLEINWPPVLPTRQTHNWDDTFTAGASADWRFADHWVLRGGYHFFQSPVPKETLSPSIPDSDQHVLTLGIGFRSDHHRVDLGYGLDFYMDRRAANQFSPDPQNPRSLDGDYEWTTHLFSFNYGYRF